MIDKSPSVANLADALSKAQAELPAAKLDEKNEFLKSRYASIGSIIEASKPALAKHELSVSQLIIGGMDSIGVATILLHSSGEWIESTVMQTIGEEKGKSHAQVIGSAITYLRRYSLAAILNMYADDDASSADSGGKTSQAKAEKPKQAEGQKQEASNGRPYTPEIVCAKLAEVVKAFKEIKPDAGRPALARHGLELCFAGEPDASEKAKIVLAYIAGKASLTTDDERLLKAVIGSWLEMTKTKDGSGEYTINPMAAREARLIAEQVSGKPLTMPLRME